MASLAGLALSLTPLGAVEAATLTVCASGCDAATIADAITAANAGDTITVTDAVHTEAGISMTKNLTIQGLGAASTTLDGGGSGPVFTVQIGVTATIHNMTISNGMASSGSGLVNLGTLTVSNSTLSGNSATFCAGGINNAGILTVSDSTLSGNSSSSCGGGIFNYGTLTVSNSTLSGNSATDGGAIYNHFGGTLTVSNSTLSGNSATYHGGGITNFFGTLAVTNSTLSGNSASAGGGINNSDILTITNSTLSDNFASFGGGGIANLGNGTLAVTNSTLSGNSATEIDAYGGGIANSGTLALTNTTLSGNSATSGGGIFNDSGTVYVKSAIVANSPGGDCHNISTTFTAAGANLDTDGTCAALDSHFTQVTPAALDLGPLALNAPGATETHALLPGSVAIDAAGDCNDYSDAPVTADQRGIARPQGAACDIGAYEYIHGPDLTGHWLTLTQTCRSTRAGQRCRLRGNVEVYNQGDRRAPTFSSLRFYLSEDATFDPATDTFLRQVAVGALRPGMSQRKTLSVHLPPGQNATGKVVLAVIDATNRIAESDKTNNLLVFGPLP